MIAEDETVCVGLTGTSCSPPDRIREEDSRGSSIGGSPPILPSVCASVPAKATCCTLPNKTAMNNNVPLRVGGIPHHFVPNVRDPAEHPDPERTSPSDPDSREYHRPNREHVQNPRVGRQFPVENCESRVFGGSYQHEEEDHALGHQEPRAQLAAPLLRVHMEQRPRIAHCGNGRIPEDAPDCWAAVGCNGTAVSRDTSASTATTVHDTPGNRRNNAASVYIPQPQSRRNFWSRRTGLEKALLASISLLVVGSFALLVAVLHAYSMGALSAGRRVGGPGAEPRICKSHACVRAAARMLARIDQSKDPCEDFYAYACGGYLDDNFLNNDQDQRDVLQEMNLRLSSVIKKKIEEPVAQSDGSAVVKAKHFYQSCMNNSANTLKEQADEGVQMFFQETWPMLDSKHWKEHSHDNSFEELLAKTLTYHVFTLFDVFIAPDERNSSTYFWQIFKGRTGINSAYLAKDGSDPESTRFVNLYRGYMLKTAALLTKDVADDYLEPKRDKLKQGVDAIVEFEKRLAEIIEKVDCVTFMAMVNDSQDASDMNLVSLQEVSALLPKINWEAVLNKQLKMAGSSLDVRSMVVGLNCKAYFLELGTLLAATPERILSDYVVWRLALQFLPSMGPRFHQIWKDIRRLIPGTKENHEKVFDSSSWMECVATVIDGFDLVAGYLYIRDRKAYNPQNKHEVLAFINEMKALFMTKIDNQDWMPLVTKDNCKTMVENMTSKVGFDDNIKSPKFLDEYYEKVEVASDKHFFFNSLKLMAFQTENELQKLLRSVDKKKDWPVPTLLVNAFHNPFGNEIIFPLGILQEPIVHSDLPMYIRYATTGFLVAHEIAHGFDLSGRRYHPNVSLAWWEPHLDSSYRAKIYCLVQQYSQFKVPGTSEFVNENLTLSENICDNIGLDHAWTAYRRWLGKHGQPEESLPGLSHLTNEQSFLVAFGQVWCEVKASESVESSLTKDNHSPGKYRTIGPLQNMRGFSEAFGCAKGSYMNPEEKCTVFS